jgi:hypothetical protein
MGRPVQFAQVRHHIEQFGPCATVVTVGEAGAPHVVSALVELRDDGVALRVGPRTRANLTGQARLTLTWPPVGGGSYQLILDGVAGEISAPDDAGVSEVAVAVDNGILHRVAGAPEDQPSCVPLAG